MLKAAWIEPLKQVLRQTVAVNGLRAEAALEATLEVMLTIVAQRESLGLAASRTLLVESLSQLFQAQRLDQGLPSEPIAVAECDAAAAAKAPQLLALLLRLGELPPPATDPSSKGAS